MRIRLTVMLDFKHTGPPAEEGEVQHEHRDVDALVEQIGQPRYVGFQPEPD